MAQKVTFGNLAKYGLFLGLALIILSLIKIYLRNFIDQDLGLIFMLLQAATYVFFIYCAIRFAVKYLYATNYSFAKGVKVGLFVGLITAIIMCVYQYIEIKFIAPELYQEQIETAIEEMVDRGIPEEALGTVRAMIPITTIIGAFIGAFLVSLLASLFISPFFKKRQTTDFNNEQTDN
jgi:hypothetical protein